MVKQFIADLKTEFKGYNLKKLGKDALAGVTVGAVALPLAIAFGISSGADAVSGLITAIIAGFFVSLLSGGSFQITGPTGAMSAILISIISKYELQGMFLACFIAGFIILLAGIFRLGKLVNFIPMPVITGFTSGIAIIIALGQIDNLFGTKSTGENIIEKFISYGTHGFAVNWFSVMIGVIVIAIMFAYPKKWNKILPSSLVAIIFAGLITYIFKLEVIKIGSFGQTLINPNHLDFTKLDFETFKNVLAPAVSIAMLGMIESLLCGASGARMCKGYFNADQELVAQGIGNIILPFFGGVPATAAIARTSVAIRSGYQTRLTGVFQAVTLLIIMFALSSIMAELPLSALAGVLIVTAFRMNEWHSIKYIFKRKFKTGIAEFLITMVATVLLDLTFAIIIGVVLSVFFFAIKQTKVNVTASKVENLKFKQQIDVETLNIDTSIIYVSGCLFFGNTKTLTERLQNYTASHRLVLALRSLTSIDISSAVEFMETFKEMQKNGYTFLIAGAQPQVKMVMDRSGLTELIGENNIYSSVDKALLSNYTFVEKTQTV